VASMETVTIASGGARSEFLHVGDDGRLYVAQSTQMDVVYPLTAPRITDAPESGAVLDPRLSSLTVTFDVDMVHASAIDPTSVTNPASFSLTNLNAAQDIVIGAVTYSPATRTATLWFEALLSDSYRLVISTDIYSETGLPLAEEFSTDFDVLADVTDDVTVTIDNYRAHRGADSITFDATVTNNMAWDMLGPVRLVLPAMAGTTASLVGADGVDRDGNPYVTVESSDLVAFGPGQTTSAATVTISNPDWLELDLTPRVVAALPPNVPPVISTTPGVMATSGSQYAYDVDAADPDGPSISYTLALGPDDATIDADTGVLAWTPQWGSSATVLFEVRAYDIRGGYDSQQWHVTVINVNTPPSIQPIDDVQSAEGDIVTVAVLGSDFDGDPVHFWIDGLPGGAIFDADAAELQWHTDGLSAGRYAVTAWASDGFADVSTSFEILVTNVNAAPQLGQLPARTIQEGDSLTVVLTAFDADGDAVTFSATNLPIGATLWPDTGVVTWTPDYTQNGTYEIELVASDGTGQTSRTWDVTVNNVNGPVAFDPQGTWIVYEGQQLTVDVGVTDPDNPTAATTSDELSDNDEAPAPLTWTNTALPAGVTFDPDLHRLTWTPGHTQAGDYSITFTATDDGDGTGAPTSDSVTVDITVRDANGAPVVADIDNQSLAVNTVLNVPVTATDGDGTIPVLTIAGLPAFATFTDNGNGTGTIGAAPGLSDRGDYMITVTATDDGNGVPGNIMTGQMNFILSVTADNAPPIMAFVGDSVAVVGAELVLTVWVSDADEDDLTFSMVGAPAGATFLPTSIYGKAELRWTPAGVSGPTAVTLRVDDSGNGTPADVLTDTQAINLTARVTNTAPALDLIGPQGVAENAALAVNLQATDANGDTLTYFVENLPAGATINPTTGAVAWTPNYFQAGTYTLRMGATDGQATRSEDVTITVTNTNRAPIVVPLPDQATLEGRQMQFTVAFGDVDGDDLTYYIDGDMPARADFDPATQRFDWTPGYDQAGVYTVRFAVADPSGLTDVRAVQVEVLDVNRAPVLDALSGHVVLIGQPFSLDVGGTDPDGQAVTWSADNLPAGAALDPTTGELTWTPLAPQAGTYQPRITVSDGELTTSRNITLVASQTQIPPQVHIELTPSFPVAAGQSVLVHMTASGVAEIASRTLTIDGQLMTLDAFGRVTYTPATTGRIAIVATATDVDDVVGQASVDLKVRDTADGDAPVVSLTTPAAGSVIAAATDIAGTVADVNLDS